MQSQVRSDIDVDRAPEVDGTQYKMNHEATNEDDESVVEEVKHI